MTLPFDFWLCLNTGLILPLCNPPPTPLPPIFLSGLAHPALNTKLDLHNPVLWSLVAGQTQVSSPKQTVLWENCEERSSFSFLMYDIHNVRLPVDRCTTMSVQAWDCYPVLNCEERSSFSFLMYDIHNLQLPVDRCTAMSVRAWDCYPVLNCEERSSFNFLMYDIHNVQLPVDRCTTMSVQAWDCYPVLWSLLGGNTR